jgi:hypothetical protein
MFIIIISYSYHIMLTCCSAAIAWSCSWLSRFSLAHCSSNTAALDASSSRVDKSRRSDDTSADRDCTQGQIKKRVNKREDGWIKERTGRLYIYIYIYIYIYQVIIYSYHIYIHIWFTLLAMWSALSWAFCCLTSDVTSDNASRTIPQHKAHKAHIFKTRTRLRETNTHSYIQPRALQHTQSTI